MSTYKVIQDVEAEDKLVGPLTLRQFIFAGIAAISGYLGFLCASKGAPYMLIVFLPITAVAGFFAFPFGKDQPTEVWALAKLRFFLKPRKRIWDQSGIKELVTITVPKKIERALTNGLDQDEVQSRLNALANTIDSRGWAIKNANLDVGRAVTSADSSDRLVTASSMPQQVSDIEVLASDDILDEYANPVAQHFDTMITANAVAHRQQLMAQMQQPIPNPQSPPVAPPAAQPTATTPAATNWFVPATQAQAPFIDTTPQQSSGAIPQAGTPTAEEEALAVRFKAENSSQSVAYGHMKTLKTPEQLFADQQAEALASLESDAARRAAAATKPIVTTDTQAAIINLAQNDDLDVATIARQAHKASEVDNGEVVISLR